MRKWSIVILFILLVAPLLAQEETLFGNQFHSGGYGGPVWKVGLVNGKIGMFSGGRGGWIINHTIAIGGGGYDLIMDVETDQISDDGKPIYLDLSYGGFELEYIHQSDKLIHWTIHTMFCSGKAKLKEHDPTQAIETDRFYMIEPSFNFDINISKWFRLGFGASYRIALGVDLAGITSSNLSGPSGLIILKFGCF